MIDYPHQSGSVFNLGDRISGLGLAEDQRYSARELRAHMDLSLTKGLKTAVPALGSAMVIVRTAN